MKQRLRHNNVRVYQGNHCQHQVAFLYQLAHYRAYDIIRVADIVTLMLAPQKWNIPPLMQGFPCRQMSDITIVKPTAPITDTPDEEAEMRRCDMQHIQPREHSVERGPGEGAIVADIASS